MCILVYESTRVYQISVPECIGVYREYKAHESDSYVAFM